MSEVIVYTIDKEGYVVDQFECDREHAINNYWNKSSPKGSYLIANPSDDIPYKWRRKKLLDVRHSSRSESQL